MTALGAISALFPLALGIGTGGAQMHQPLAIAIIGGLIIALPLLLMCCLRFLDDREIILYHSKFYLFLKFLSAFVKAYSKYIFENLIMIALLKQLPSYIATTYLSRK